MKRIMLIICIVSLFILTACGGTSTEISGYSVGGLACSVNAELYISSGDVCQSADRITLNARNSANTDFVGLQVIVTGQNGITEIKTSNKIYKNQIAEQSIDYDSGKYGEVQQIRVVPGIMQKGSVIYCYENQVVLDDIPKC